MSPPRIHIVGRKNAGKTTLVCDLIAELTRRGLRVASVKHTHHHHELDTPGKDSFKHRAAGAAAVGILAPQMTAVFIPADRESLTSDREQRYAAFEATFRDCDLIIVEGDLHTTATRVEVWRSATGQPPWCESVEGISCLITDEPFTATPPGSQPPLLIPRSDISHIASTILNLSPLPRQREGSAPAGGGS